MSDTPTRMPTRAVHIGSLQIGAGAPIAVQSMCATKTRDIDATVKQIEQLAAAGAGVIRIAVDNDKEVAALKEIRAGDPSARVVMCSAMGQQSMVIESIQAGAKDFIVKPFQPDRVLEAVQKALA